MKVHALLQILLIFKVLLDFYPQTSFLYNTFLPERGYGEVII